MAKNSKTKRPVLTIPKARPGENEKAKIARQGARTTGVKRKNHPSRVGRKKFRPQVTSIAEAFEHVAKID